MGIGNLKIEFQESTLTESEADELRSFILSFEPRACLVQPDVVEVFDIDADAIDHVVSKLQEIGASRAVFGAPAPAENHE